ALSSKLHIPAASEHKKLIKAYAQKFISLIPEQNRIVVDMCDAFDLFSSSYASSGIDLYGVDRINPGNAGSYYMACILYASLFGKTAYGMEEYGYLDKETASLLQKAAHRFVFGKEPSGAHAPSVYTRPAFEDINPKTASARDSRFKGEKFPKYFDELFAAAYAIGARGKWVQYDQQEIDRIKYTTIRRSIYTTPEEATPQNTVYLDCSGYAVASYYNAFGYSFDDEDARSAYLIDYKKPAVFTWDGTSGNDISAESATESFLHEIEPGDVIVYRNYQGDKAIWGHVMTYMGNGLVMHCSGSSRSGGGTADYDFPAMQDSEEYSGGILFESIDELIKPHGKQYIFASNKKFTVLRPLSLGLNPTEQADLRVKNLAGIIAYKETSAPRGVTVNSGDSVTFAYVLRNDCKTAKTVSLTDTLPAGLKYISGDVAFEGGKLNAEITVPARGTARVSYTASVTAANGSVISDNAAYAGGVKLNGITVRVENTLTAAQRAKITEAAGKIKAGNDYELVANVYKEALGATLPFTSKSQLATDIFKISDDKKDTLLNPSPAFGKMISCGQIGGRALSTDMDGARIKIISQENLMAGDVILTLSAADKYALWLCLDGGALAVFENGAVKVLPSGKAVDLVESLFGHFAFCVFRPSQIM
ncbi:MAG: C40 family peptidase, partial [Clostridia bacterium]|nr:C40 family peptidase [Clostridia bacterium]